MASIISIFTTEQLEKIQERGEIIEKIPETTTGEITASDNQLEFYLEDPNATFFTSGVQPGDTVEIIADTHPAFPDNSSIGSWTISGYYLDPHEDGKTQVPWETRLRCLGVPPHGDVTYRIIETSSVGQELNALTENSSRIRNVTNVRLQELDDIYREYHEKFNVVCNHVNNIYKHLRGLGHFTFGESYITAAVDFTTNSNLFPTVPLPPWTNLYPNRTSTAYTLYAMDDFGAITATGSEVALLLEEEDLRNNGGPVGGGETPPQPYEPGDPLESDYIDVLNDQLANLALQDADWVALLAEIADNDTSPESGRLQDDYNAMVSYINAQRADITKRIADINTVLLYDRARAFVPGGTPPTGLYYPGEIPSGILANVYNWVAAIATGTPKVAVFPYSVFYDYRYQFVNLRVNRAFGTRANIQSNTRVLEFNHSRYLTLEAERDVHNALLDL